MEPVVVRVYESRKTLFNISKSKGCSHKIYSKFKRILLLIEELGPETESKQKKTRN